MSELLILVPFLCWAAWVTLSLAWLFKARENPRYSITIRWENHMANGSIVVGTPQFAVPVITFTGSGTPVQPSSYNWSIDNTSTATINGDATAAFVEVDGVAAGSCTLSVTVEIDGNSYTAVASVAVTAADNGSYTVDIAWQPAAPLGPQLRRVAKH